MPEIKIKKIDSTIENRIITGMIVSDEYLTEIQNSFNTDYFQNQYAKTVAIWCAEYFDNYEKAPFKDIENIFDARKGDLEQEEVDILSTLLKTISDRYATTESINVDYLLDQTLFYFKKRELEITSSNIQILLEKGDVDAAEKEVLDFHKVSRVASEWINPLDSKRADEAFDETGTLFTFGKGLGEFVVKAVPGWLIGIMGPFKRGKTWFADEWGFSALIDFKKVAKFSLEMNRPQNLNRLFRRLTALPDKGKDVIIPVFDCAHNQYNRCDLQERKSSVGLVEEEGGALPEFNPHSKLCKLYKPCSVCRTNRRNNYQFAIWYVSIEYDDWFDRYSVKSKLKAYEQLYHDYYRLRCYPRFTANIQDMQRDLDILEKRENFVPQLIVVDMVDITAPERKGLHGVEKEDEAWMALAKMASERHCVVVTPTQVNKEAQDASDLGTKHTARWVGKLGHVDAMFTINQTPHEKRIGFTRIGCIDHRHLDFDEERRCYLTQNLNLGQFHLDSWVN